MSETIVACATIPQPLRMGRWIAARPSVTGVTEWIDLTRRAAFASHRLVGWIFWDPGAKANLASLGVPDGLGHYIVNRAAPLAAA